MRISHLGRYALSVCAAATLAGCVGESGMLLGPSRGGVTLERTRVRPAYSVLYSFKGGSGDGENPLAGLINVNGTLYGTTLEGGANCGSTGCGTVFSVTTAGVESLLYSFNTYPGGSYPRAGLVNISATLYGTTTEGGASIYGTVFSLTPSGKETVLHNFGGGSADGQVPYGDLIKVKGTLYGTTESGGANLAGTVFSITTSGKETVLYSFGTGSGDGEHPYAGLINVNGTLYGTTEYGGANGDGTVFKITTSGKETVLYSFRGKSGKYPKAGLLNVNGTLYGTTTGGGAGSCIYSYIHGGCGTVYAITSPGKETVLYSFKGGKKDGQTPRASLINVNGTLYGTTYEGGPNDVGTVFSVTPSGKETVLYGFSGKSGKYPEAGLLNVNGTLYGTTESGGANGDGTVFSLSP
jgi:uncharacterized repeat protein (TIGR03803 family)